MPNECFFRLPQAAAAARHENEWKDGAQVRARRAFVNDTDDGAADGVGSHCAERQGPSLKRTLSNNNE